MGDLLTHLVDAPLANILILAGLAFLGVGIIGKIGGKIEPSVSGRVMASVVGLGLLSYGIYAHSVADMTRLQPKQSSETQAPGARTQPVRNLQERGKNNMLTGNWKNDNAQTRGVTRLEIQQEGQALLVHAWGACRPQECDWGAQPAAVNAGSANVVWEQGVVSRKMTLTPDAGRLRMSLESVYQDRRPSHQEREYFVKAE
jgi:hypothetical protein